ncbi:MAG: hypothetical protein ABS951_15805 [Solibacillus sp.]
MSIGQHIRVLACVVFMALLVGYVINGTEIEKESKYIDYVQMQPWPYNTNLTIAQLLEQQFDDTYWEYYTARTGEHVVQMTAHINEMPTILQFIVQQDLTSYQFGAIKLNEITLSKDKKWLYVQNLAS